MQKNYVQICNELVCKYADFTVRKLGVESLAQQPDGLRSEVIFQSRCSYFDAPESSPRWQSECAVFKHILSRLRKNSFPGSVQPKERETEGKQRGRQHRNTEKDRNPNSMPSRRQGTVGRETCNALTGAEYKI